jgi:prepilin-type processing-associated H-X9-DG protein
VTKPLNSYVANAGMAGSDQQNPANGIFVDRAASTAPVSVDDILDGTTHTLLLSENVQATTWTAAGKRDTVFVWHPTTSPAKDMLINGGNLKAPLTASNARPSSYHRGGVNVAFADTHVTFLKEDIDYKVYMHLMTSNGQKSDMPAAWKKSIFARGTGGFIEER